MKLFLRLTGDVNVRLRVLLRYRGDLSRLVEEALSKTNLMEVELGRFETIIGARGTTAMVSVLEGSTLKSAAMARGCSTNALANSAISNWLSTQELCA